MKTVLQGTSFFLLFLCLLFTQCSKTPDTPVTPKSSIKTLTSPTIDGVIGASSTFDAATSTYTLTVPSGTDVTALKVSFTLPTGATAKPTLGSAQNFTSPVVYTVTAEDGSTSTYTVKVVVIAAPKSAEKQITAFMFATLSPVVSATIDQTTRKITATIPASADLISLVPTLTISAKSTVSPNSGVLQNFTNPVNYTVTAEDGSKQSYEVKVEKVVPASGSSALGTLVISNDTDIKAIDAATGNIKWTYSRTGSFLYNEWGGTITQTTYFHSTSQGLIALNLADGTLRWRYTTPTFGDSYPVVVNDVLYFSDGSAVYALNATTGAKKWSYTTNGRHNLTVANNRVFAGADGVGVSVLALDATTGEKKMEYLGSVGNASPKVANGLLYVSTSQFIRAYDIETAQIKWQVSQRVNPSQGTVVTNNLVYVQGDATVSGKFSPSIIAYDANTGVKKWEKVTDTDPVISAFSVDKGLIAVTSRPGSSAFGSGSLSVLNAVTGELKWEKKFNSVRPFNRALLGSSVVYMTSISSPWLSAFDAQTGNQLWSNSQITTEGWLSLVGADGTVYHTPISGMQP